MQTNTLLEFTRKYMNWTQVSDIGNSKVVKSMMIWLIVTPILAKALDSVDSINFAFLQPDEAITISLPFSWQVFFFCALVFTIANLIYVCRCPLLIRKYTNYYRFKESDNSLYLLVNYFEQHITDKMLYDNFDELLNIVNKYSLEPGAAIGWNRDDESKNKWRKGVASLKYSDKTYNPDIFSALREMLAKLYPCSTMACVILYGIGFFGIGFVVIQNIIYVLS